MYLFDLKCTVLISHEFQNTSFIVNMHLIVYKCHISCNTVILTEKHSKIHVHLDLNFEFMYKNMSKYPFFSGYDSYLNFK